MMVSQYSKRETRTNYLLVLAELAFFALGNPKLLEHRRKFFVFMVVFRGWTGFDSFTISVVVLRDERWVIAG